MKTIIFTMLLTVVMAATVMAQRGNGTITGTKTPEINMSGMQTDGGTVSENQPSMIVGNSFMLVGTDREQDYSLAVSLDYSSAEEQPGEFVVGGGTWTLSIYRDGNLVGTIFGDVTGGAISETNDEAEQMVERSVSGALRTQGGTGEFEGTEAEEEASASLKGVTGADGIYTKASVYNVIKK